MLAEEGMMGAMGMSSEESMLDEMLKEEGMMGKMSDEESSEEMMLDEMLAEEGMMGKMSDEESSEEMLEEEACGEYMDESTDFDIGMDADLDTMGLEDEFMGEDEMHVLASIYGDKQASAPKAKQASRASVAVKPQPKKASTGATRLGGVTKEASDSNDLSKLWESAPDISKHF